jgi:hypothetical protein
VQCCLDISGEVGTGFRGEALGCCAGARATGPSTAVGGSLMQDSCAGWDSIKETTAEGSSWPVTSAVAELVEGQGDGASPVCRVARTGAPDFSAAFDVRDSRAGMIGA